MSNAPTLSSASSFNLNNGSLASSFYNATLTGGEGSAAAHLNNPKAPTGFTGDTIVANGFQDTIYGGANYDSLLLEGYGGLISDTISSGHDTLVTNGGSNTLLGNASSVFQLGAASLLGNNSLKGTGSNLLIDTGATELVYDSLFANMSGIGSISLSGSDTIVLGSLAGAEKLNKVVLGNGGGVIERTASYVTTTPATLIGGTGNDRFIQDALAPNQSIAGGAGIDTLQTNFVSTLSDSLFTSMTGLEVLSLKGGSSATLGANASKVGFTTVTGGGVGSYTINASADTNALTIDTSANSLGHDLLTGTSKNDLFIVNGQNFGTESVNGGAGVNTLSFSNSYVNINDQFTNDKNIQVLSVSGPFNSVTLGANAMATGIRTLTDSDGYNGFTQLASDTLATTFSLLGSAAYGYDTFTFANQSIFAADTIYGNTLGGNTIQFLAPVTLNDGFSHDHGVQNLSLNGSSQVTLAANASAAGLNSVVGGTGPSTIIASADTPAGGALTLDMRASTMTAAPGDLLVGSFLSPTDFIVNATQLPYDSISGGAKTDTLSINNSLSTDDGFLNIRSVEVLSLGGAGSAVTLGANASGAGIHEVYNANSGNDTIYQTSSETTALTLIGGNANNFISVFSQAQLAHDSIVGGMSGSTLQIGSAAYLNDNAFSKVSDMQALALSSQSSVTLGNNAENAGIASVFGGAGSDTFTQLNTAPTVTLVGGGDSDLFKIQSGSLLTGDSIIGGLGTDTLAITSTDQTLNNFNGVTGIEVLSLSGGNNEVNLTGGEGGANFSTVIGGSGNDSFAVGNLGTIDIIGGAGIDTVSTATSYTISDSLLGSLKSVEVLQTGSSYTKVTLGSAAQAAGISSLIGGTGSGYTTVEQSFANNLYYDGTASSKYQGIGFANQQQFANATLVGNGWSNSSYGSGMEIASASTLSDYAFRNKSGLSDLYLNASEFAAHSEVTFSSYASAAGVKNVYGKNGSITFNQSTLDADGIKIDDSWYYNRGGNLYNLQDFSLLTGHTIAPGVVTPAISTLVGQDTIYGAGLTDTLAVGGFSSGSSYQPEFQNVHNVGVLSLTGGGTESSKYNLTFGGGVLLDNSAEEAGIQTVYGSQDNSYIIQTTDSLNPTGWSNGLDIYGGRGNDLIGISGYAGTLVANNSIESLNTTAGMLANDVIDGGRGVNTLGLFTDTNDTVPLPINYGDSSFTHVKNIQALAIYDTSSSYGSSVTLGGNAFNAGIQSVFGGENDTIYADWNEVGRNLTLDVSAYNGNGHDLLIGQQERGALGFENIFVNEGLGNIQGFDTFQGIFQPQPTSNEFIFGSGYAVGTSTVIGGLGYRDSLYLNSNSSYHATLTDNQFSSVGLINNLVLNGNSSVTLGAYASNAFGAFGTGSSKYGSLSGVHTVWGGVNYDTLTGNTLGDTIIQDSTWSSYHGLTVVGGHGNDYIGVANSSLLAQDSIYGGYSLMGNDGVVTNHGMDTLEIGGGVTLNDSWGKGGNVKEIEALVLSCSTGGEGVGSAVTLGSTFQNSGLSSIYGSGCNDTIVQLSTDTLSTYINGGAGNDTISIANPTLLGNDTINGGTGTDTLNVANGYSYADSLFANVSNIQVLTTTGSSYGYVTLGGNASTAGISSVIAASSGSGLYLTQTSANTQNLYINTSLTSGIWNNGLTFDTGSQFSSSTIVGSTRSSSYSNWANINQDSTLTDSAFANKTHLDSIYLSTNSSYGAPGDGSSLTVGSNAAAAGVASIYGGYGNDTITITADDTLASYINAEDGNDLVTVDFGGGSTISGGATPTRESLVATDAYALTANGSPVNAWGGITYSNAYSYSNYLGNYDANAGMTMGGAFGNPFTLESADFVFSNSNAGTETVTLQGYDSLGSAIFGDTLSITGAEGSSSIVSFGTFFSRVYSVGITGDSDSLFGFSSLVADTIPASGAVTLDSLNSFISNGTIVSGSSYGRLNFTGFSLAVNNPYNGQSIVNNGISETIHSAFPGDFTLSSVDYLTNGTLSGNDWVITGYNSLGNSIAGEVYTLTGSSFYTTSTLNDSFSQGTDYLVLSNYGSSTLNSIHIDSLSYILPTLGGGSTLPSFNNNTLNGGAGTDTLNVGIAATLSDSDFVNVSNFEALHLTGSSQVTLGASAQSAGFASIYGGDGGDTISVTSGDTLASYILGGSGNDLVNVAGLSQFTTLDGGGGSNTLELTGTSINDGYFGGTTIQNFGAIALGCSNDADSIGSAVTLGAAFQSNNLNSLIGSDCNDTITQSTADTLYSNINAGAGNDLLSFANTTLLANDTINGGTGSNTIDILSGGNTIGDSLFANVSNIQALSLTGANTVYFNPGSSAQSSGLSSIYGGAGSNFITANFTGSQNLYLQGQGSTDTLVAGGGNDTLQAWNGLASSNTASDTYTGGSGSDNFVLGDTLSNAYGQDGSSPKASITDFNQSEDYLDLHNYGSGASDYTTQTLGGAYNFEVLYAGNVVTQMYVQSLNAGTFLTGGHVNYLS